MERVTVECLRCGSARRVLGESAHRADPGECPRCGYLGWAPSNDLNETARRRLRERAPEQRISLYAL